MANEIAGDDARDADAVALGGDVARQLVNREAIRVDDTLTLPDDGAH